MRRLPAKPPRGQISPRANFSTSTFGTDDDSNIEPLCDVTLHTLRHTALSRMISAGYDDYTVMAISGHSSTRMLARYTHPTEDRKLGALNLFAVVTKRSQNENASKDETSEASEIAELLRKNGGRREARTRDLRIANAALSQLS